MNLDKLSLNQWIGVCVIVCAVSLSLGLCWGSTTYSTPPRAEGLMKVEILEECHNGEGQKWYLLQVGDGQRGFTHAYRGKVGDVFYMWPDDIGAYKLGPTPPEEKDLIGGPQINLGATDATDSEKK